MTSTALGARRLRTQRLSGEPFASALDAVGWLGAVQSQDYAGAKWALGQRTRDSTDADLEHLFSAGAILRTHVLRPTWHFVLPEDIRWMLELTAPHIKARMVPYDRQFEIDPTLLRRSYAVMEAALGGGAYLTRNELATALEQAGRVAIGQRLGHLVMHAELDAIIISGPRRGNEFTYALFDERVPATSNRTREEALAELTRRYFTGHGPAQLQDFAWWSGLTAAEGKRGLALTGPALEHEVLDAKAYWSSPDGRAAGESATSVHLLPNYDELLVAYRDRTAALDPARAFDITAFPRGSILTHVVVVNGHVRGGWKRRRVGPRVVVELAPMDVLDATEAAALERAAARLARFLALPVTVSGLTSSLPLPR